jgi:hypothetical protein
VLSRTTGLVAIALAAALIAAGCGDDDETTTASVATTTSTGATGATGATGEALTKAEFIKQADEICASGDKTIDEAFKDLGSGQPSDQEAEQVITDTVVPEVQGEIDGIRALTPPEGDEDEVTAILDAAQSAVDQAKEDPSLLTQQGEDPFQEANQLAKEYGLKVCGQG